MVAHISFPRFLELGPGAVEELGSVLVDLDVERPLLVTDAFMVGNGAAERLMRIIEAAGKKVALFSDSVPDPTTDSLQAGVDAVKAHDADVVIGFGGGSPMDTAKALAVLAGQGGAMREYKAPRSYAGPALPIIAIPTTAGSGSEATQFTIITDLATDEKMLCPGLAFLPIASIVDSELTMSMPARLTADTGIDALTHAIEAYVSKKANPISDEVASAKLIESIDTLCATVEVPAPSTYGIDKARWEELIPLMAEQALASGSPSNNPVVPTADDIAELYRSAY